MVDEIQKSEKDGYDKEYPLYLSMPGITGGEIELLKKKELLEEQKLEQFMKMIYIKL
jgi:hypothetical protein